MDYTLYVYGFVACAAVYAAVWTAGGQGARLVLSLGAYAYHPRYVPPSRAWRQARIMRRENHTSAFPSWHDYFKAAEDPPRMIDIVDTVIIPLALEPPALIHAEQAHDEYGAEHWGALLEAMNTEERTIYSAEVVEVYQQTKAVERPFLDALDAAVDRFAAAMAELDGRHAAMYAGVGVNLAKRHGGDDRWSTGQYALIPREPEPAAA